ncbi:MULTISPECIES: EamA family transporter [unclassified Actinotalea]|uniref:EamA family transporter n=1 Tax=unclassified Actinotalea TaxID=2638618 RepID=UPI0015F6F622|nr:MULTISPECIES: EamA family transporter [unclassified Actinotalea]
MSSRDRLLALVVAVLWGANFLAIHASLEHFPPFFLAALRFALIAVPTVLLVPRPAVRLRWLVGYGVGFGILQFGFLFLALTTGMPTGLSSLVLQSSAPFTVLLAAWWLRERLTGRQVAGVVLAVAGLAGIAVHRGLLGGHAAAVPVLLTVAGGLGWALGNLASRQARPQSPMRLMAWMSVVPPLPLLALSLALEGPEAIGASLTTLDAPAAAPALLGLAYSVLVATVVGSGIWTTLLARNPSSSVAPFSMLVPVVGIALAALVLGERAEPVELCLGVLVVVGVLLGSLRRGPSAARDDERGGERGEALAAPREAEPVGGGRRDVDVRADGG